MSTSALWRVIASAAFAACLASQGGTEALSQGGVKGKLGTANVQISRQAAGGGILIILRQGREFARYSAPTGEQGVLLCCNFGDECTIIGVNEFPICEVVISCPTGTSCSPQ